MGDLILDGHKLLWHRDRLEAWIAGERIAPITIDCSLTRRCTYKCVYCYGKFQSNDEKRMTRDAIFRFLDDAVEIGVKSISFVSDGESTCSPHIYEAILRGRNNGLDIALGTNGYLLQDDKLEEVLPNLTYLRFNISAGSSQQYAKIMGCGEECFDKVYKTIKKCVEIKKKRNLSVTLGMQMVLMPKFMNQLMPFVKLGEELGVDYAVIKHCSDNEKHSLKVDYQDYFNFTEILKEAESYSKKGYLVKVKWSKILSGGKRKYKRCYGPAFIMQFSGSGLVAPCGMLFNRKFKKFHIGNIVDQSFKQLWRGERYWEIMKYISSDEFNPQVDCGTLCLQHKVNEFLWEIKDGGVPFERSEEEEPQHVNFI